jgi:hypothetical protein
MSEMAVIDLDEITEIAESLPSDVLLKRLQYLMLFLTDPAKYSTVLPMPEHMKSHTSSADVKSMLISGNFEFAENVTRAGAVVFAVPEPRKNRRRSILWPPEVNAAVRLLFTSTVKDCIPACALGNNRHTRCFDLKSGFYQLPLGKAVRHFFAFQYKGVFYQPTRVPMGVSFAPDLLEAVVSVLAAAAVLRCANVDYWVHIDNVRFSSSDKAATDEAAEQFVALCQRASVTITEEDPTVFLGVQYDFVAPEVRVRPSRDFVDKLRAVAAKVLDEPSKAVMDDIRELISRCIYASRVARVPLGSVYNVIKFLRRHATVDRQQTVPIWPSIIQEWRNWIALLSSEDTWTVHPRVAGGAESVTLFTDASLHGWGAVLCLPDGTIFEHGEKWQSATAYTSKDINRLEARAVHLAASFFADILSQAASILLVVDNSSVQHSIAKGSSASGLLNTAIVTALSHLPHHVPITVSYIPSVLNPADKPSRGERFSLSGLRSACGLVAEGAGVHSSLRVSVAGRRSATLRV